MRKIYWIVLIFFPVYTITLTDSFAQIGPAQKVYNSISSGFWTDIDSWEGDEYPDTKDLNKAIVNINQGYYILLEGSFDSKHWVEINIFNDATLEITQDVVVGNRFIINVYEGGNFIVGGDVHIGAGAGGPVNGQLIINGDVEIGGDLTGNGNVSGDGYLYVGGIIGDGITFDGSNVTVICGTMLSPHNLDAEVLYEREYFSVELSWDFDNSAYNSNGIEYFLVTRDDEILGTVDYGSKDGQYIFIDEGLEGGLTPIYKVYAVYYFDVMSEPAVVSFENNPLPIELIYFKANTENKNILLEWATAAEINNDFFTIERSIDGRNWDIIDYVQGAGNSNITIYYEYKDKNPVEGISYYRLKQTDYDGQFEYFGPVAISFINKYAGLEILNVRNINNNLNVVLNCRDMNTTLAVVDMQGRIIYKQNIESLQYSQEININLNRNYSGEVLLIRLYSNSNSDTKKAIVY